MRYKGVSVIVKHNFRFKGEYKPNTIIINAQLKGKERMRMLEHEYLHHKFFTRYNFVLPFLNGWINALVLVTGYTTLFFMPISLRWVSLFPLLLLTILILHEIDVYVRTKDFGSGFKQTVSQLGLIYAGYFSIALFFI